VTALALQVQRSKDATLEIAHAQMRGEEAAARPREPIPEHVKNEVWRRDQGRCVDCGSREKLEFDHIIPVSEGGSNTARNIELRCESCNRRKGNEI
jgi:5-methylcytosine-specific restriction endonuclease McrA